MSKPPRPYCSAVAALLKLAEPGQQDHDAPTAFELDYAALGLSGADEPDLLRLALDKPLWLAAEPECWGPMHAARALAQLRCAAAIPKLVELVNWLDAQDHEIGLADIEHVLAAFGQPALDPLARAFQDARSPFGSRLTLLDALSRLAQAEAALRPRIVKILTDQLRLAKYNDLSLNSHIVSALIDLSAADALPVIRQAFDHGHIDARFTGELDSIEADIALTPEARHAKRLAESARFAYEDEQARTAEFTRHFGASLLPLFDLAEPPRLWSANPPPLLDYRALGIQPADAPMLLHLATDQVLIAADDDDEHDAGWAPLHAAYALAQLGHADAVAPLIRAFDFIGGLDLELALDHLAAALGCFGAPAVDPLLARIVDRDADQFLSPYLVSAFEIAAQVHPLIRPRIIQGLIPLLARADLDPMIVGAAASTLATLGAAEALPAIQHAYDQGWIEADIYSKEEILGRLASAPRAAQSHAPSPDLVVRAPDPPKSASASESAS